MTAAAAPSQITVTSIPFCLSSHAVSLEPCSNGRVSSAKNPHPLALLHRPVHDSERGCRSLPSARDPALQWVRTLSPSDNRPAPCSPMRRQTSRSALADTVSCRQQVAPPAAPRPTGPRTGHAVILSRIRRSAQNRLTAVGLVPASRSRAPSTSAWKSAFPDGITGRQRNAVCRGDADGGGSPNPENLDASGDRFGIRTVDVGHLGGQAGLIQQAQDGLSSLPRLDPLDCFDPHVVLTTPDEAVPCGDSGSLKAIGSASPQRRSRP